MADATISELTALTTPASGDLVPVVDVSDTTDASSGTTKRTTVSALAAAAAALVDVPAGSTPIGGLAALATPADGDLVAVLDVSDTTDDPSGTVKAVTVAALADAVAASVPTGVPGLDPFVLVFPAGEKAHVNHGFFWRQTDGGYDLGSAFFWSVLFAPLPEPGDGITGYIVDDGGSGGHALLLGLNSNNIVTGNIWNGSGGQSFAGGYSVASGEWVYLSLSWDGEFVTVWINGLRDRSTPFAGPRKTLDPGYGPSPFFACGPDHNNYPCKLALIEGYDNALPVIPTWNTGRTQAFIPARNPYPHDADGTPADFFCDYTRPTFGVIPDLSEGYAPPGATPRRRHHGTLGSGVGDSYGGPALREVAIGVAPHWEADPTCPFGRPLGTPASLGEAIRTPPPVPVGARIFDSFSRGNQTWASHAAPSLGSTEGGTLGVKAWSVQGTWGILEGHAVPLGGHAYPVALVDNESANMTVAATCPIVTGSTDHTTKTSTFGMDAIWLALRAADHGNHWYVWWQWYFRNLQVGYVVDGVKTSIGDTGPIDTPAVLSASFIGTTLTVYRDGVQVVQYTGQTRYQTATKCGLDSTRFGHGYDSAARYTNFTVS